MSDHLHVNGINGSAALRLDADVCKRNELWKTSTHMSHRLHVNGINGSAALRLDADLCKRAAACDGGKSVNGP